MQHRKRATTRLPDYYLIYPETPIPLAKQHVTPKKCECGCHVRLEDTERNELLCPVCGLVYESQVNLSQRNLVYGSWSTNNLYTGAGYTYSEKQFMKSRRIKLPANLGTSELNKMDYQYLIDVFKVELCLSPVDVNNVWLIIRECKTLKNIHPLLNYERILLGICKYILHKKGVKGYLVNLNNTLYREYNLTRKDYNTIEKNIEKYRALYRCNT